MTEIEDALKIAPCEVLAFVGAGGMTGFSLRVAAALREGGRSVLSTSTVFTHEMRPPGPFYFLVEPQLQAACAQLPALMEEYGHVQLTTEVIRADKIRGIEPEWVSELARIHEIDNILVQADGARHRPLKAPKEGEPALPNRVDVLLVMAGLDALGKPLGEESAHRPEQVSRLTGLLEGEPITPEAVACVLAHPEGGLRSAPAEARVWFVLTGWIPGNDSAAHRIARDTLRQAPHAQGTLLVAPGHSGALEAILPS